MMKKFAQHSVSRWSAGLAIAALTFSVAAHAALKSVDKGQIAFHAVGPGGLKIDGTGSGVEVSEAGPQVKIKGHLTDLKTGITLRDDHLKKFLKTDVNKYAVLTVPKASLKIPAPGKTTSGSTKGKLELNGKGHGESINYKAKNDGGTISVQGLVDINFTNYGYEKPCYLGVCVDENVKLKVKFQVKE